MRQFKLTQNIGLGVKNLMLHKLRSFLTMLGVVLGVSSVVIMLSIGEGASKEALERIRRLGSTNIMIHSKKPADDDGATRARLSMYGLFYEDQRRLEELLDTVDRTVPVKHVPKEGRLGTRTENLRVVGTTPAWFDLVQREMLAGRQLAERDELEHKSVVVLTEKGARKLLAAAHSVGQSLRIGSGYFEVVGIIRSEAGQVGGFQTPDRDVDAYVPLSVARDRFGDIIIARSAGSETREQVELNQLIVQVRSEDDVESTAAAIEAMLKRFHPRGDYEVGVPLSLLREAEATRRTFNFVLGSIAGISLLVGGIGIMNIMLASVTERTREIGIRRAIGAKRRQIVGQFLIETVVLSMVGGLIGVVIGVASPAAITYFSNMPTVVTTWSLVLSVGISMGVGIVFGLYPAVRAANLDPIEALRHV